MQIVYAYYSPMEQFVNVKKVKMPSMAWSFSEENLIPQFEWSIINYLVK